jgi:hypothetical protein
MKWIKLFSGTVADVEQQVNDFTAAHKNLPVEFIEARPTTLHGSGEVGALVCLQYDAKQPVILDAEVAEVTE